MMKKLLIVLTLSISVVFKAAADEGMWLPLLLGQQVYNDMVKKGLKPFSRMKSCRSAAVRSWNNTRPMAAEPGAKLVNASTSASLPHFNAFL